ncbi:MAG: hypothetical protein JSV27_02630 [Candidatus Bathyarchaeota archaeon]|nr:MAG: hypothetical protein JSV27_02630 [Candidatus Bathyarchaeota archaeon]
MSLKIDLSFYIGVIIGVLVVGSTAFSLMIYSKISVLKSKNEKLEEQVARAERYLEGNVTAFQDTIHNMSSQIHDLRSYYP